MSRHQRTRIREIDFRRPFKFSREQVRRIEHAHEGFTRTASSRMSASLRTEMQIGLMGADQLPYSTVMSEELPRQSLVSVLRVDPLDTQVALVMESPMALSLVDRMLGGTGTAPAEAASLTDVELAVSRRVIRLVVDALSATWLERAGVSFSIADIETSPSNVQIVPASEPTLLLNFSVTAEATASILTLCLPHRSVEKILSRFEQPYDGERAGDGSAEDVEAAVGAVEVGLRAVVGHADLPVGEILRLGPGDVLRLGRRASEGVVLHTGEVPTYAAAPGRNGKQRAVQVTRRWSGS